MVCTFFVTFVFCMLWLKMFRRLTTIRSAVLYGVHFCGVPVPQSASLNTCWVRPVHTPCALPVQPLTEHPFHALVNIMYTMLSSE